MDVAKNLIVVLGKVSLTIG